jgi:anti-sigma regulatory factor (Ser/Thr protein kinase)
MSDPTAVPLVSSQIVSEHAHLVIPSSPDWIEPTVEHLRRRAVLCGACQETRSGKLMVALHEALSNALLHGNLELSSDLKECDDNSFARSLAERAADPLLAGRKVDIVVDFDGEMCQWVITDQGKGFDVEKVLARCLSDDPEVLLASGRGILMMKSFLDEVRYELGGRRVILTLNRLSGEERRKDLRLPLNLPFHVTPMSADGSWNWSATYEAVSRNFSEHGIALLQEQLAHSQRVLIGIPRNQEIIHIPAEVKHTRALGASGLELGCRFEEPIEPSSPLPQPAPAVSQQLQEVHLAVTDLLELHQSQQLPTHERRAHPRVVFNERVLICIEGREPIVGYARDLSKGGIALISQEPITGEIILGISPHEASPRLKVRCRVVRCAHIKDHFYDIGATFLRLDPRSSCEGGKS